MNATASSLSPASLALFTELAKDNTNWNGQPMINIAANQRWNLTDLKKRGLLTTFKDEGVAFAIFTDAGKALAKELGYEIHEI